MGNAIKELRDAAGKEKKEVNKNNLFRKIGFDGNSGRLGWALVPAWDEIKDVLSKAGKYLKGKNEFIFVGMGGSANGVKTVASFISNKSIHVVDSLDPRAMDEVIAKIKDLSKTLVIPISKSGTTKETQNIANSLRRLFPKKIKNHFLWLVDKGSSAKLDHLGWKGFSRLPIQVNYKTDIGGRFTSPHTMIFFLPLFILLGRNFTKLKKIYDLYCGLTGKFVKKAFKDAKKYKKKNSAYYSIVVNPKIYNSFNTWIVQLFQESLGSKIKNFPVKTLVSIKNVKDKIFTPLNCEVKNKSLIIDTMCKMFYFQHFVAFVAYFKKINFINQPSVEKYKNTMRSLTGKKIKEFEVFDACSLGSVLKKKITSKYRFVEVVIFAHLGSCQISQIEKYFKDKFPKKRTFVFIGSDWNHHSYQAAFADGETFFVLLTRGQYQKKVDGLCSRKMKDNIETMRLISYATYLTIKNKAFLGAFKI